MVYITPCPCKNDMTGLKYANQPVPAAWHAARPINFAREIVRYEIMRGVPQGDTQRRRSEPVVLGPTGHSWTKTALDGFFKALVALVVSPDRAKQLSIHSFRVWLVCALLTAGATPELIMLMLRWSSDAARRLYARVGDSAQVTLYEAAADAAIDSIRSHTLFALDRAGGGGTGAPSTTRGNKAGTSAAHANTARASAAISAAQAAAAHAVQVAEEMLRTAMQPPSAGVTFHAETLAEANISLDDNADITRLSAAAAELRVAERKADELLEKANAEEAAGSNSDCE